MSIAISIFALLVSLATLVLTVRRDRRAAEVDRRELHKEMLTSLDHRARELNFYDPELSLYSGERKSIDEQALQLYRKKLAQIDDHLRPGVLGLISAMEAYVEQRPRVGRDDPDLVATLALEMESRRLEVLQLRGLPPA